jgi:hypothetical protein
MRLLKFILAFLSATIAAAFLIWLFDLISANNTSEENYYRTLSSLFIIFYLGQMTAISYKKINNSSNE